MAYLEFNPPQIDEIRPSTTVAQLSTDATPAQALSALRREGQNAVSDSQHLADQGVLTQISIGGLAGEEAEIAARYERRFALEATATVDKGIDPRDGAQVMIFRDQSGKPQEVSIEDKAGSHQYVLNSKGEIVEGRSFDGQGNGVELEHVKWTLEAVTRSVCGRNYINVWDGDKKQPGWS